MDKPTIAVDFDGVIHRYSKGWYDGTIYDIPVTGCKDHLKKWTEKGYRIVIFTTRLNPEMGDDINIEREKIDQWLKTSGFIKGVHYDDVTALKPKAVVYIDDRAIRFINWETIDKMWKEVAQ